MVAGPVTLEGGFYLAGLPVAAVVWLLLLLLQHNAIVGALLGVGSIAILGYIGWFVAARCDKVARDRFGLALVLIAGSVVFWTLFEQAGRASACSPNATPPCRTGASSPSTRPRPSPSVS